MGFARNSYVELVVRAAAAVIQRRRVGGFPDNAFYLVNTYIYYYLISSIYKLPIRSPIISRISGLPSFFALPGLDA